MSVGDSKARVWYEQESKQQNWSVRTLQRNVETQYYYRLLSSQNKRIVEHEMKSRAEIEKQKDIYYLQHKNSDTEK